MVSSTEDSFPAASLAQTLTVCPPFTKWVVSHRSNKPADKDAYKFAWGIGGDALVYEIAELNTTPLPIIATQVVQYKLPTNINFSGTGEIYFSISQAGTIIFPNNDVTITVDQVQLRKRRTLTINRTTGRVDMSNETTY